MPDPPVPDTLSSTLLDAAPVRLAFHDRDQNVVWANQAYRTAAGVSDEELQGRKCFQIWKRRAPCKGCAVAAAMASGEPCEAEVTGEDSRRWPYVQRGWLSQATPVKDAHGAVTGVLEAVFDISKYVTRHRCQQEATATLLHLFEYANSHTARELLREFLDAAERLTGSRIGFYHFVEDDQQTLTLQTWSTNTAKVCTATGAGTHYPIAQAGVWVDCVRQRAPVIHNDYPGLPHKKGLPEGHSPVTRELVVPVIRSGKLVAILGVGNKECDYDEQDVKTVEQLAELAWETVVRKRAEEQAEKLRTHLARVRSLEAVGQLAGGVAHDFNNLLMGILNYIELCREELDPDHAAHDWLNEITTDARRSADLVRQLLAFARKQVIKPEVLDLNHAVQSMLRLLRRLLGEDIDLRWTPGPDIWPVCLDPSQVDQLIANLCVNARDAIGGVGTVAIETGRVTVDRAYCATHSEAVPGDFVVLTVKDDGCGMDRATLEKIFEPFFSTKAPGHGTGLGLATVYGIVKQNNGFVGVISEPDQGSTFRIHLPRAEGIPETPVRSPTDTHTGEGSETVLLVEDEKSVRVTAGRFLADFGYTVLVAKSPDEALRQAREHPDRIDLLITDVVMPGMNGRELAEELSAQQPELKVLFMSGYTADVVGDRGIMDDDVCFIAKPVTRDQLARKVREVLEQSDS